MHETTYMQNLKKLISDHDIDFDDINIVPRFPNSPIGSRKECNCGSPVIVANMDGIGTLNMATALSPLNGYVALSKFQNFSVLNENNTRNCWVTIGMDARKLDELTFCPTYILMDVANGYMTKFKLAIEDVRKRFPNSIICAGNVCTHDGACQLYNAGADLIKVGLSHGAHCRTKLITGVGRSTISSIIDCLDEKWKVVGDGGFRAPSDCVKGLACGATWIMCGTMFAGTPECIGDWKIIDGKHHFRFYGMSSRTAMENHHGKNLDTSYKTSEGDDSWIPMKDSAVDILNNIHCGIRSAMAYLGCGKVSEIPINSRIILK